MKSFKFFQFRILAFLIIGVGSNCSNEDDAISTGITDVSSRVAGYGSEVTGAGATLTINGTELSETLRVFFGNQVVPKKSFISISDNSIALTVPANASLGETEVFLVFPGDARAFAPNITVVARPVISLIKPFSASSGETVTIMGNDLNLVTALSAGSVSASITSQSPTVLKFTMPDGAATGTVSLTTVAGDVTSTQTIIACSQDTGNDACKPNLLLNGSLDQGNGDEFTNWNKFNGGARLLSTVDEAEVLRGTRALKAIVDPVAAGGGDQWRLQFASDPVGGMEVGASYTLSAWVKSTTAGTTIRYSTQPSAMYQANTSVGTDWTLVSWTFNANVAETRMVLDLNGPVNTIYFIDDIRLIKN